MVQPTRHGRFIPSRLLACLDNVVRKTTNWSSLCWRTPSRGVQWLNMATLQRDYRTYKWHRSVLEPHVLAALIAGKFSDLIKKRNYKYSAAQEWKSSDRSENKNKGPRNKTKFPIRWLNNMLPRQIGIDVAKGILYDIVTVDHACKHTQPYHTPIGFLPIPYIGNYCQESNVHTHLLMSKSWII